MHNYDRPELELREKCIDIYELGMNNENKIGFMS